VPSPRVPPVERLVLWSARAAWALLPVGAGPALGHALAETSRPVQVTGSLGAWLVWGTGLVACLVPTTVSLTVWRLLAPGPLAALVVATLHRADGATSIVGLAHAALVLALVLVGEVGEVFVQGSAYGAERRFPLRAPGPLVLGPLELGWLLAAAGLMAGPLGLAAKRWWWAAPISALGAAWAFLFAKRCHRLSRRFLVFVPAGFVVHDHLVLAETALFRSDEVRGLNLAPADTEAADATGKALGPAIEVHVTDGKIVLAGTPGKPGGTGLHVRSVLVSPTRPGRVLAHATDPTVRRR
jgi:hypothetical protein